MEVRTDGAPNLASFTVEDIREHLRMFRRDLDGLWPDGHGDGPPPVDGHDDEVADFISRIARDDITHAQVREEFLAHAPTTLTAMVKTYDQLCVELVRRGVSDEEVRRYQTEIDHFRGGKSEARTPKLSAWTALGLIGMSRASDAPLSAAEGSPPTDGLGAEPLGQLRLL